MNWNVFLPKELVRKLSGFFMLEENCRGYDPNTPIGEIAKNAFKHWQRHEQEVDELKRVIRRNADLLELEKEKVADARSIACYYQDVIHDIEEKVRIQKRRRCLALAHRCRWMKLYWRDSIPAYSEQFKWENRAAKWEKRWRELADEFKE